MPGRGGRPTAEQLEQRGRRCQGVTTSGARCKAASVPDLQHCPWHLSDIDKQRRADTGAELLRLTRKALAVLEAALDLDSPARVRWEDRLAAAKTVLARTAPTSGPQVLVLNGKADDGRSSEADLIRTRLAEIRGQIETRSSLQGAVAQPFDHLADADIVDAEIVPEPEPVVQQEISDPVTEPEPPEPIVTPTDPDVTVVVEGAFGVPRVTSRPVDLSAMGYLRSFRDHG